MRKNSIVTDPTASIITGGTFISPPQFFLKCQGGGGKVLVWGCFLSLGKPRLFITTETLNSVKYISILENVLLPYADEAFGEKYIFQHDNAPIHTSNATKAFLKQKKVEALD